MTPSLVMLLTGWPVRCRRLVFVASLMLAAAAMLGIPRPSVAAHKISYRQITRTHPIAVQRGTKARVRVWSNFTLDNSHSAFFVPAGIRMTQAKEPPKKIAFFEPKELDQGEDFGFDVEVPAGQVAGVYEYRIATDQAVSSVGHLLVTDHPVVTETSGDNNTPKTAQTVSVPSAVCGNIADFEDVDLYRIRGRAGQELVCQIFAQRVTRLIHCMAIQYPKIHLMDSYLTLRDERGRVVAENDNFVGGDAMLRCRLPSSGDYFLEVRDSRYAGDPRYVYCVEITEGPLAVATFPVAVQRGHSASVEVVETQSINVPRVPVAERRQVTWNVAADAVPGWRRVRIPGADSRPGPVVPQLVSPHLQRTADGRNLKVALAMPIELPVGISGRFQRPGQTHFYRFRAKQQDVVKIDVQSQRRGLAVDGVILVMDAKGKILATADDGSFTKDAGLSFRVPADGEYVIGVRDLNRRSGDRFIYHMSVVPSGPDFEVHGEYYYGMLAPGGHAAWFVRLNRLNGFDGPVEILVDRLPRGVTCQPVVIPSGVNHCALVFSAGQKAPINASLVRVRGRAKLPRGKSKVEVVREANVLGELRRAGASRFVRMPIRTQLLGVTRPLDLHAVTATPVDVTLKPGGTSRITVRIKRSPEYSEQVLLNMALLFFNKTVGEQLPPGVSVQGEATRKLTGDMLEATFTLAATAAARPISRWPIAVVARVPITYTIMTSYASNPVFLTVAGAEAAASPGR